MTAFDLTARRRTRPALGKICPGGGFGGRCEDRRVSGRDGRGHLNLDPAEARRRFAAATVARLATVSPGGGPHLVPVTFAVDGDVIYSAVDAKPKTTTRLARLRNIAAEPRVALLADHYGPDWDRLWWVRADGAATVLAGAADMAAALALLAARYPQYQAAPPGGPVIRVQVERWTGWAAAAG
jgi:PPOX class probable F420-dependent enzyme